MSNRDLVEEQVYELFDKMYKGMYTISKKGGLKHGYGSWKEEGNQSLKHKNNIASIFRHLAQFSVDPRAWNEEEQCFHLENAITRLAMALYRIKQNTYEKE